MKSYKNLYDKLISEDNIKLAIHNASLGKHERPIVRKIYENQDKYIPLFIKMLAYIGWISATDVYGFYQEWIKPYVDIGYLKKRISYYDRRHCLCGTKQNTV